MCEGLLTKSRAIWATKRSFSIWEPARTYGLDVVAARVWTLLEQPTLLRVIHETIVSEYDVDAENCQRDILAFLDRMQAIGLVEISSGSAV